jgi:hypothetical protein
MPDKSDQPGEADPDRETGASPVLNYAHQPSSILGSSPRAGCLEAICGFALAMVTPFAAFLLFNVKSFGGKTGGVVLFVTLSLLVALAGYLARSRRHRSFAIGVLLGAGIWGLLWGICIYPTGNRFE